MSWRHSCLAVSVALIALLCGASAPAAAQNNTPGGYPQDNGRLNGSISHEDLEKLNGNHKDVPPDRAKAQAESEALLKTLQVSCTISNAALLVSGTLPAKSGAKQATANVYEVACAEGSGYILETQGSDPPLAISCVHAEDARAQDVAKGAKPGYFCALPENKDVYAYVARLIQSAKNAACTLKDLRWFGRSDSTHTEYSEVVCKEGTGYLLGLAQPGTQGPTTIMSCAEAAERGIKCVLTDAGPVKAPVTLDTLRAALAQNGVSCKIDQLKLIGQEEARRRYVVEYLCADQGASMVAFIPLEGNTAPYEAFDCARAAKSGVNCSLSK
jgi:hypothetical protein